ncbi:MAG TPA: thioredoxin domain-containing protein [Chloroflexota bacterium]|nr:thioredoxin domain-containing protein [Chloroflexota bacterium]HUM67467.1 thioredoxin domain-containing protein [Chloroflexota bacterium]
MAKQARKNKKKQTTNWWVIGGVVIGGMVLVGLMALALREPETLTLERYCEQNPGNCIVEGAANAPVTVVEVSDYGCGHCRNFNLDTAVTLHQQYVETGQVKWVVMPFALSSQPGGTMPSAIAALCAAEQDNFSAFHRAAFNLQSSPLYNTTEGLQAAAESAGLDTTAFAACLADNDYEQVVRRNMQAAASAGINSTPSFALGADIIRGNLPLAVFQQRIESLLRSN